VVAHLATTKALGHRGRGDYRVGRRRRGSNTHRRFRHAGSPGRAEDNHNYTKQVDHPHNLGANDFHDIDCLGTDDFHDIDEHDNNGHGHCRCAARRRVPFWLWSRPSAAIEVPEKRSRCHFRGPWQSSSVTTSDSTRSVLPILAPRGWNCSAGVGADGSVAVDVFPSGTSNKSSSFERSDAQGVSAYAIPGCQGCISETACPLVPAAVEGSLSLYSPCPYKRPRAEEVRWAVGSPNTPASDYTYDVVYFTDPPGVAGDGDPSGGPFTARGVLAVY